MNDQLVAIESEQSNGSLFVRLTGEIDLSNSDWLHQQLERAVDGRSRVVIDLTGIEYLDSQGLRLIKQLCATTGKEGTHLQLVAPPDRFVRQVLEMACMSDYVAIRDAPED